MKSAAVGNGADEPSAFASVEAEQAVLGALMLDNASFTRVWALQPDHFAVEDHRAIFFTISSLLRAGKPADPIAVYGQMIVLHVAERCGGLPYLDRLVGSVPSASGIAYYAGKVMERARVREIAAMHDEIGLVLKQAADPQEVFEQTRDILAHIGRAATTHPSAQPRRLDLAVLAEHSPPERQWFRPGWLGNGATLLAARGGSGKSMMVQHEATCGALGRPYFAPAGDPCTWLILNAEDEHDEMWRRQVAICQHEKIGMRDLAGRLHLESRYGCDNALMVESQRGKLSATPLLDQLREWVNDLKIDVLNLDNAAHYLLANHDDRIVVTTFVNTLIGLVVGRPFGVVITGHISRAEDSEFTGSVAWENACRMRWFLSPKLPGEKAAAEDDENSGAVTTLYLAKRKANYSARDWVRFTVRGSLLVPVAPAMPYVDGVIAANNDVLAENVCMVGLKRLNAMGVMATDSKNGDYLPKMLLEKGLAGVHTQQELGKAMNRLMKQGLLRRDDVGKYTNRTARKGLIICEAAQSVHAVNE